MGIYEQMYLLVKQWVYMNRYIYSYINGYR